MGLHNSRATRSGQPHVTQMYVRCTGQKTTGSSLSRPFATPHAPLPTRYTRRGNPPRLACLLEGCEGSRRCEWVIPHPSLLMSDALSPLASIPGFGGAPVNASRLKLQPPSQNFLRTSTPTPREFSTPHTTLWGRRLNFLNWRPRGLDVSCRRLYLCGASRSSPSRYRLPN